ncbi:MAG: HU family DNA-binding protein [Tannerellaceae bacterium]|nr:HU family DNA-binding protein [Tannerellaceae bacterium]
MNNRLSIPEIAGLLAEYCGADKKTTERFLKEFVLVVRDAVFEDKIVKIKGIGTFKIIEVQDRESVDVNTGKRILIPGHYKFSFVPDKDLKEEVNKPFSFFETVEISEHIDSASMEHPDEEDLAETSRATELIKEEPEIQEDLPQEINLSEEVSFEAVSGEPEVIPVISEVFKETEAESEAVVSDEDVKEGTEPEEVPEDMRPGFFIPKVDNQAPQEPVPPVVKKQSYTVRNLSIVAVLFIAVASGVFFFLHRDSLSAWNNNSSTELGLRADSIANNLVNELLMEDSLKIWEEVPPDDVVNESQVMPDNTPVTGDNLLPGEMPADNKEIIATVKIEPGNRLTLLALEYYGNKVFWVYLYEYNKDIISDPNNIPVGRTINIPAPELYNINSNSKASVEKATILQSQILQAL